MSTDKDVLFRILQTEAARGHDNKTVIGGISKIAPHWITSATSSGLDPNTISQVTDKLNQYSNLSLSNRELIADELLAILTAHYTNNKHEHNTQEQLTSDTKSDQHNVPNKCHSTDNEFNLETPLTALSGIGPSNSNKLKKLQKHSKHIQKTSQTLSKQLQTLKTQSNNTKRQQQLQTTSKTLQSADFRLA